MPKFIKHTTYTLTSIRVHKLFGRSGFRRAVELQEDLVYQSKYYDEPIIVPTGFISDGASIPQVFWWLWTPFDHYLDSAVVHDYLCRKGRAWSSPVSSITAGKIFNESMKLQGVNKLQRWIMTAAVIALGPKFAAQSKIDT